MIVDYPAFPPGVGGAAVAAEDRRGGILGNNDRVTIVDPYRVELSVRTSGQLGEIVAGGVHQVQRVLS